MPKKEEKEEIMLIHHIYQIKHIIIKFLQISKILWIIAIIII
jgi:hypothetical protein